MGPPTQGPLPPSPSSPPPWSTRAGACIGVLLSVSQAVAEDGSDRPPDFAATLDEALGLLEDGLPL
jgi:hypothetical protein